MRANIRYFGNITYKFGKKQRKMQKNPVFMPLSDKKTLYLQADFYSFSFSKHRNIEISKHRNIEISKHRNIEIPKHRQ